MPFGAEQILGWNNLTKSVQLVADGVPDFLPKPFFTTKEEVPFDKAVYVESFGMRKLARKVPYGAPGQATTKLQLAERDIRLMNFREILPLNNELVQGFRQWDKYELQQKGAINQIDYHGRGVRARFDNIRKAALTSSLAYGAMYFDADGYLLPTSSGAVQTIDQGIPAVNTGAITDVDGSTTILNAQSWATAATPIVQHLRNLHALALKRSGRKLKYAIFGKNVAGYLAANTQANAFFPYMNNGNQASQIIMEGKVPDGFMGLEWIPAQSAFFEQENGTIVDQWPADNITFFPEVTTDTYTLFEGTTMVPTLIGITANETSAFNSFKPVVGMGAYAKSDEFSINLNYFDVFLPRFKAANSVFILDTTP